MENTKRNLLALSLVLPSMAQAFGLGEITVHSKLGEPLRAEIAVTDPAADQDKLTLALAGKDDFYRVGLELTPYLSGLQFRLKERDDGSQVIEVTTRAAAREPFLSFLLEANWSSGRMLKEYTLLLDPPVFDTASSASTSTPSAPAEPMPGHGEPAMETMHAAEEPAHAEPAEAMEPASAPTEVADAGSESYGSVPSQYEVQPGDTLWEVARDLRPDAGVDINTMMMALLETNPEAFIDNNINGLKRGAILRVPDRAEIDNLGLDNAQQLVREQNALWQQYRGQLAEAPSSVSEATSYEDGTDYSTGTETADAELRLVPPAGEDESRASVNAAGTADSEAVAQLEDELNRTREELATREQEAEELASRVSELEALVDKLERAINIKDNDLAALQAELEAARAAMADAQSAIQEEVPAETGEDYTATEETGEPVVDEAALVDETTTMDESDAQPDEVAEDTLAADEPQPDEFSLADDMAEEVPVAGDEGLATDTLADETAVEPAEEMPAETTQPEATAEPPSDMGTTLGGEPEEQGGLFGLSWTMLGALGGGVILLLILLLLKKRGGKTEEKEEEQPPEMPPVAEEETVAEAAVAEEEAAEAEEEEATTGEENDRTETETVEPVIALDDEEEPDLSVLDLGDEEDVDLSDIYEGSDVEHPELESTSGEEEPLDLEGLYDEGDEGAETTTGDDFDFDLELDETETGQEEAATEESLTEDEPAAESDDSLDFDFDLDEPAAESSEAESAAAEEAGEEDFSLDFDLDSEETPESAIETEDETLTEEPAAESDDSLDFDLDLDEPAVETEAEAEAETVSAEEAEQAVEDELEMALDAEGGDDLFDDEETEEELEIPTDDLFEDEDAVATKLDLARAYLDMGDPDGARTMLEEVVQEGNDEQKAQAQELLDGMS